ncbi:MAG: hypothetical protein JJ938_17455, partial [Roseicyclus sp.]|nr:hypothetical protein [Roseicyclus sp.]
STVTVRPATAIALNDTIAPIIQIAEDPARDWVATVGPASAMMESPVFAAIDVPGRILPACNAMFPVRPTSGQDRPHGKARWSTQLQGGKGARSV